MTAATWPTPTRGTMFTRAIRRRCPRCGGGPLFHHWIRMAPSCPRCGLPFSRNEDGYHLGAIWFNLLFAEAVSITVFLVTIWRTWPDPPWAILQVTGPIEAILAPVFFYPFSKTLFLAFDLIMRPVGSLVENRDH
jgi:uncharacterized protein (DUF983 family)